jgi:hypothetical protein
MSTTSLYNTTQQTGTVSSANSTSLYSNTSDFTTGLVNSSVYSVNGSTGVTVNPTTGNVVVSIGQDVATTANVTFADVTATGNLSNNYYTLANAAGTNGQVLTTDGAGATAWTTVSSLGVVTDVSGSGAGINVSPTTGSVVVSNTGVTSAVAGTGIGVSAGTGAVTFTNTGVTSIVAGTNISISGATGAVTVNATDTNTTYTIDASSTTGGANLNLVGSDSSTDSVKFASGTGITVTRTDANTITITNTDPGTAGVTSITGTTNQVIVSSPTGAVTLSTPQDIATTSNPVFAGVTGGNVTVGVVENNTIATTTGNLIVGDASQSVTWPVINSAAATPVAIQRFTASTNLNTRSAALVVNCDTTPTVGFGNTLEFQIEAQPGNIERAGNISVTSTDLTTGSEDFKMSFFLMANGAAASEKAFIDSAGNLTLDGGITVSGSGSGSSTFNAPATGSTLSYVLPGAAGAANTVLTNDGSGNLSWALPGGGGSTFGNITVGVATDNTISTTTGDLVLASATNVIDATTAAINAATLTVDGRSSVDSFTITTTSTATVALIGTGRNAMTGLINIVQGANVHCVNFTAVRVNVTTALLTTFAEMYNTSSLATFTADVSGGDVRVLVTPASATSTIFNAVRTSLD